MNVGTGVHKRTFLFDSSYAACASSVESKVHTASPRSGCTIAVAVENSALKSPLFNLNGKFFTSRKSVAVGPEQGAVISIYRTSAPDADICREHLGTAELMGARCTRSTPSSSPYPEQFTDPLALALTLRVLVPAPAPQPLLLRRRRRRRPMPLASSGSQTCSIRLGCLVRAGQRLPERCTGYREARAEA